MIEVKITPKMVYTAKKLSENLGTLNNSITEGDGNVAGFLGEIISMRIMKGKLTNIGTISYDFDMILPNGMTIDVKTKRTTVKPKEYYECSVAAFNTRQKCDAYSFVRVNNEFTFGWWLGWKFKDEYFNEAIFLKKGQCDLDNNFIVKADCYNLKISRLNTKFPA